MEMKKRSLNRDEWTNVTKKITKSRIVNDNKFNGTVGYLKILDLKEPVIVENPFGNIILADKNYTWLQFAPKNENYWLTIMFDEKNNLIESYFDITRINVFENELNPYYIDLKLDVVILPNNELYILDEDELKKALKNNFVTKEEYKKAIKTANDIVAFYKKNTNKYLNYINYWLLEFENKTS